MTPVCYGFLMGLLLGILFLIGLLWVLNQPPR